MHRRLQEDDHYKVLNVARSASVRELKKAYHKMAVEYHPDKTKDRSEVEREAADVKFKAIALVSI